MPEPGEARVPHAIRFSAEETGLPNLRFRKYTPWLNATDALAYTK